MCGIAGFLTAPGKVKPDEAANRIELMTSTLVHRGPDQGGVWSDAEAGVALGHRRLSILDLSPAGKQPMVSPCGRFVVVFNGEIYNFQALRKEFEQTAAAKNYVFRGHSDTEVLLAAVVAWGLEGALKKFNGMFAFALWDRESRTLHLARDRVGKKPLYYGWCGDTFLFGSELKALRAHPAFRADVSRDSVGQFLRFSYVPAPYSIFNGIAKLLPASYVSIKPQSQSQSLVPIPYWSMAQAALTGIQRPFAGSDAESVDALEMLLTDAVRMRMVADVPLGAFLSGGIDSSLVVALMQSISPKAIKTFTIGFGEADFNEAPHAKLVAEHLGTEHTELYVDATTALATIPRMPELYDEPLADPSQIPTYLVSRLTREHVTVSLSGDGGDEFFSGYERYKTCEAFWRKCQRLPVPLRLLVSRLALALPPSAWRSVVRLLNPILQGRINIESAGETVHRVARMLGKAAIQDFYGEFISFADASGSHVVGAKALSSVFEKSEHCLPGASVMTQMMYLDAVSYLPDDVLTKVDRASMGVSLEVRNPLLDYRVIELAWQLAGHLKFADNQGKRILRHILYKHVPREIIDRPKMGFGVPIAEWLRGPLRGWAEDLLSEYTLREQNMFVVGTVRTRWLEHLSGRQDWSYYLWNILMFQAWSRRDGSSSRADS